VSHVGGKLSYVGNNTGYVTAPSASASNVANYNMSIQYVELPFTIKLKSSNKGKMDYWANFGGFLAIPVKARADYQTNLTIGTTPNFSNDNENVIGAVQPINIGMQIGGGIELPISDKNVLVVGLVFNNGFIDVTKNGNWGGDGRVNLNSMALRLGIFF
jgi:hypothetical protein